MKDSITRGAPDRPLHPTTLSGSPSRWPRRPLPASNVTLPIRIVLLTTVVMLTCLLTRAGASPGTVTRPDDAPTERMAEAIRNHDMTALNAMAEHRELLESRDRFGNTPLMFAAHLGHPEAVRSLLAHGADPNATNLAGATPLLRAATDPHKVRLLLAHHAHVEARSALGHTPLMLAARCVSATDSVRLLLDHGAAVNARSLHGATPLMAAAASGNLETVRLLVDHGADIAAEPVPQGPVQDPIWGGLRTPLMWAAFRGHRDMVAYLLDHGADVNQVAGFGTALTQTGWRRHEETARLLIERGANLRQAEPFSGFTTLHWAASSDLGDATFVEFLLRHGADPNAEGGQPVDAFVGVPQTPVSLAQQRGDTSTVRLLQTPIPQDTNTVSLLQTAQVSPPTESAVKASTSPEAPLTISNLLRTARNAVPPLQQSAELSRNSFLRHASRQDCASCHQQYFPMAAVGLARSRGIPTDHDASDRLTDLVLNVHRASEIDSQALFHPDAPHSYGYALLGLRMEGTVDPVVTDPLVAHLAAIQAEDGHWSVNLYRPPLQSSDITATALGLHALRFFGWSARAVEFEGRIRGAREWLLQAQPGSTEEASFQLLGLAWAGVPAAELRRHADRLLALQRPDGGWSQLPGLSSDAYATGQALFSLAEAAAFDRRHPACQRAARFLVDSQANDGTWHVRRRAFPFQPTMDSGFPYGRDGWISATGTSWAVMALARLVDPGDISESQFDLASTSRAVRQPPPETTLAAEAILATPSPSHTAGRIDFEAHIRPLLERSCVACHSGDRARSGYRVTDRKSMLAAGNLGTPAVIPGQGLASPLMKYLTDGNDELAMPPKSKRGLYLALSPREVEQVRDWIDQGAPWPSEVPVASASVATAAR